MGNRFTEILARAKRERIAAAAFNIVNEQTMRAILAAAEQEGRPVILQTSAGTVRKLGCRALGGMINSARDMYGVPFALHLDHCRDAQLGKDCIDNGWDAVMMDYSALPLAENIANMREIVAYAHDRGVAVEGEVGLIKGVEEDVQVSEEALASYEDTVAFMEATGVDAIAPAIGTAHGQYTKKPCLKFDLVQRLALLPIPVVVHGGTGLDDQTFLRLVACGAAKINISTAVKASYLRGMAKALESGSADPLTCDGIIEKNISEMAAGLIRLFSHPGGIV